MCIINDDKRIISVALPLIDPPLNSFEKRFLLPTGTPICNTNKIILTSTLGLVLIAKKKHIGFVNIILLLIFEKAQSLNFHEIE